MPSPATHSRFVQRIRRRYSAEMALLPEGLPLRAAQLALLTQLQSQGRSLACSLRVARQLIVERLCVLDVEQAEPMQNVTRAMTEWAEVALNTALQFARAELDARYGQPHKKTPGRSPVFLPPSEGLAQSDRPGGALNDQGQVIDFWVVGMGKLGGRELNVSSDIDLIYVIEQGGSTQGPQVVDAHEYFAQLARRLYALIGETTEDGFVFRMDLALRPHGASGPMVLSLGALEDYLQAQGREWERIAWLKSRVVAPQSSVDNKRALALRDVITPFVYRRHLDYGVFESLRQLHRKVRDQSRLRALGRSAQHMDVKLGRGGIREIEFIVQSLLVVRGGQFPEMRTRSTLKALFKLSAAGLMTADTAQMLAEAYILLRRVEHRIQYLEDQQTHVLPTDEADLNWIAQSLDLASGTDLLAQLQGVCVGVQAEFDALFYQARSNTSDANQKTNSSSDKDTALLTDDEDDPPAPWLIDMPAFWATLPEAMAQRAQQWFEQGRVRFLNDDNKRRLAILVERMAQAVNAQACSLNAAQHLIDWLEALLRRTHYLALLAERPEVLTRLLRLMDLARWPARYLMRHPDVIDELADSRFLHDRFNANDYQAELETRFAAWQRSGQAGEEMLLDTLRHAHHAEVFRTLMRDVEGHISVEEVADDLSALADATLDCTLRWAWRCLKHPHRREPRCAVIAYGKLGGKELGYGSDLDVVFVYDDADERAPEVYATFVRKLIQWMTLRTPAGELFDIDTALRPNGNSGLLVTSIESFERYQSGRGSNTAWTWEHQALTRARWCAGLPELLPRFEATRCAVLAANRDLQALRDEVISMRSKLREAQHVLPDVFDLKHSPGGMIDVEFVVQFMVLAHSRLHPHLLGNKGNIALLLYAQAARLLPSPIGSHAAAAYRELRRAQHKARLDEALAQCATNEMTTPREAVLALWEAVLVTPFSAELTHNNAPSR
jgi:[glutamine synthetase] adenylyltransferase / [glutamine synthetase]-adenylyl-L-tyrosine phosphorylase